MRRYVETSIILLMILFLCTFIMAKKDEIQGAMNSLRDHGPLSLNNDKVKKFILRKSFLVSYGISEEEYELNPKEIDDMVDEVFRNGSGSLLKTLDADLEMISSCMNSVIIQAPILLAQMSTIPVSLISTTAAGPTVPNPVQIKNTFSQVKATASSMASYLNQAFGKVIEYGLEEYIPDIVISTANILATIKNFPI